MMVIRSNYFVRARGESGRSAANSAPECEYNGFFLLFHRLPR